MNAEAKAIVAVLDELWAEVRQIVQAIGPEGLGYVPLPGMNSTSVIVRHIAGSQKWWVGGLAAGRQADRDREAEFAAADVGMDDLLRQLDDSIGIVRQVLESLTSDNLDETRFYREQTVTVHWILVRVVNHVAVHVGHLQMTRQLWEQYRQDHDG
jgi:hypothetical protein